MPSWNASWMFSQRTWRIHQPWSPDSFNKLWGWICSIFLMLKGLEKRNFKWPWLQAKMAMPDSQRYHWNLSLIKNVEETVWFWLEKCLFMKNQIMKAQINFAENPQIKMHSWKKQKYWFLIQKIFLGYCCKSGIVLSIFAWRVTWNYSSFKRRK